MAVPEGVAFEVDHFEWIDDRLEVSGRWYGLRGHRFVRPALTVEVDDEGDDRRRMLADLEHKPWAADDGADWIAAFPWDGEPVALVRAELAVAPTLAVDLPLPRLPGRRKRASTDAPRPARPPAAPTAAREKRSSGQRDHGPEHTAPAASEAEATLARQRDTLARERDALIAERAAAIAQRDAAISERNTLAHERDEAIAERAAPAREPDSVAAERDEAIAQRDAATSERDTLARDRDSLIAERDAANAERSTLARERDAAVRARAAAVAERDDARRSLAAAISERDALLRERDSARAARQRDLEALDELADRGPSPSAPRPLPRQSALALWGQRLMAVVALGVFAFVLYTLLEGVV